MFIGMFTLNLIHDNFKCILCNIFISYSYRVYFNEITCGYGNLSNK